MDLMPVFDAVLAVLFLGERFHLIPRDRRRTDGGGDRAALARAAAGVGGP